MPIDFSRMTYYPPWRTAEEQGDIEKQFSPFHTFNEGIEIQKNLDKMFNWNINKTNGNGEKRNIQVSNG